MIIIFDYFVYSLLDVVIFILFKYIGIAGVFPKSLMFIFENFTAVSIIYLLNFNAVINYYSITVTIIYIFCMCVRVISFM